MGERKAPTPPPPGAVKPPPPPPPPGPHHGLTPEAERAYLHDPVFHAAVHYMTAWIDQLGMTRDTLTQAVEVASVRAQMIQYDRHLGRRP